MTTFPRDLPSFKAVSGGLTLERQLVRAPTRGGLQQVADVGTAIWRAAYQTRLLQEDDGIAWEAWIASLRGGVRLFRAFDHTRRYAYAYRGGYAALTRHAGGSFADGTAVLSAIGGGRDTATISTLPSTFVLTAGDLFSVTSGSLQTLHRAVTGATASSGAATVECEPRIPEAVTTGAAVQLANPWIKAAIDQASVKVEWQPGRRCSVAFQAWQTQ